MSLCTQESTEVAIDAQGRRWRNRGSSQVVKREGGKEEQVMAHISMSTVVILAIEGLYDGEAVYQDSQVSGALE